MEYLVKGYIIGKDKPNDWFFHESDQNLGDKDIIKIPEGAESFNYFGNKSNTFFLKKVDGEYLYSNEFSTGSLNSWHDWGNEIFDDVVCLWQRDSVEGNKEDDVNSPSHYNKGGVECIDAIESSMTKEAFCGYLKGNVIKYMYRYENKGGVESLKKAQWYLNKLIEVESNGDNS